MELGSNKGAKLKDSQEGDKINKHLKGSGEESRDGVQSEKVAPANGDHLLSEEFQEFLSWKASQVIDRVVDEVLEETATKVMEEEEGSLDVASENPVDVDSVSQGKEDGKAVMEVEVTQVGMLEGGSEVCANLEGVKHCMLKALEELADAKLMGAALISEVVNSLTRASPRLAEVYFAEGETNGEVQKSRTY